MPLGTLYSGMTGLLTFSKGLDVLSNNVANLNTPGFKRSDLLFRELFYQFQLTGGNGKQFSSFQLGNGVTDNGSITSFAQGEIQGTGNQSDVAIDGNGFFILRDEGNISYTRNGQFRFDDEGFLVSASSGARVSGIDAAGKLIDINITDFESNPAKETSEVKFENRLSTSSGAHEIKDVEVFDVLGTRHLFKVNFTNNSSALAGSWLVQVRDQNNNIITSNQEIRFNIADRGQPIAGFNQFTFSFQPDVGAASNITFFFGDPGTTNGVTSTTGRTDASVKSQDGYSLGSVIKINFERDGVINLEYSNEQDLDIGRLALAWFSDLQSLTQIGGGLFVADPKQEVKISSATQTVMGQIVGKSVEISNVELTQEFTDLIIVQRGFQASSQVVSVTNEMIQQLLDMGRAK